MLEQLDLRVNHLHPIFGKWETVIKKFVHEGCAGTILFTRTLKRYLAERKKESDAKCIYYIAGPRAAIEVYFLACKSDKLQITPIQIMEFVAHMFGDELDPQQVIC